MSEVEQSSNQKDEIIKENENLDDENNKNEKDTQEQNQNFEEEKEDVSLGEENENNIEEEENQYESQKQNEEEEYKKEENSKKEEEKEENINNEDIQNSKKDEELNIENDNQKSLEEEKKESDEQNKNEINNEEKINEQNKEQKNEENVDNDKEEEQNEIKSQIENNLNNENEKNNSLKEEKEKEEIIHDNEEEKEKEKKEQIQENNKKEENQIIQDNKEVKENEIIDDNKKTSENEENKNKEIINEPKKTNPKKSEFKVIKNIEITHIQDNKQKGIQIERERPYTKREGKELKTKRLKDLEINGRPHYVFYYRSSKTSDNSNMNTLDSMSYSNCKNRPNYQFFCSFGTKHSSPKKNQTYLLTSQKTRTKPPIGIASITATTADIYNSPKNNLFDIISKSDMKTTKSTNIFKPVPRTLIQTTKIQTRYQPRKYEYEPQKKIYNKIGNYVLLSNRQNNTINNSNVSHNTSRYISTKYEEKKQINKNTTYTSNFHASNTYCQESDNDKPTVKYYIRCPNCNFPLNDEKEVSKIFNKKSFNPPYENRRKNQEKESYQNKTYIKSSCNNNNKPQFQNINNTSNYKKIDTIGKNGKIGSYLFRSCIQNAINNSFQKEKNIKSPKNHHNFYQSYGTSAKSRKNLTNF